MVNYTKQVKNKPSVDAREYNWLYQSGQGMSGDLSASGAGKVLTFVIRPYGLAVGGKVYVSAGIGTAEACEITALSGTAGAAGTCTITTANTHTGSWCVGSATAGIQEAWNAGTAAQVVLQPGSYNIYTTLKPPAGSSLTGGVALADGSPSPSVTLTFQPNNVPAIQIHTNDVRLRGFRLAHSGAATPTSDCNGIETLQGGGATAYAMEIRDVAVIGFYRGIVVDGSSLSYVDNVLVSNCYDDGLVSKQGQGYWSRITSVNNRGDGLQLDAATHGGGYHPFLTDYHSYAHGGWGIRVNHSFVHLKGGYINNESLGGILIASTANGTDLHSISDCVIEWSGENPNSADPAYPDVLDAPGIKMEAGAGPISLSNVQVAGANGNGIIIASNYNQLSNVRIQGPGQGAQAGHVYGLLVSGASNQISNSFTGPVRMTGGTDNMFVGNTIHCTSDTIPAFEATAGTRLILTGNNIYQAGAAGALTLAAGVTYMRGENIIIAGAVSNAGAVAAGSTTLS